MAIYGYARVSTTDQDPTIQVEKLTAAGCTVVRDEKVSGTSRNGRNELETLLTFMRPGDTLMVTKVDRLARSVGDLQDIVKTLRNRGVSLKVTDQPIDTSTAAGKAFLDMLGVFAEFETNLRRERQMEGSIVGPTGVECHAARETTFFGVLAVSYQTSRATMEAPSNVRTPIN
jgi:DNA invertase Pin-like site-specific DNA recombinase